MKLPKKQHRVFRLPFADAPESRAKVTRSMAAHGLFVPADQPEPIGSVFPLQLTFQGGTTVVSGRVRVTEHAVHGRVRGYFVKYVELEPGSLELPLPSEPPPAPEPPRVEPSAPREARQPDIERVPPSSEGRWELSPPGPGAAPSGGSGPTTFHLAREQLPFRRENLAKVPPPVLFRPPPERKAFPSSEEDITPAGIIPRTAEGDTQSYRDYSGEDLLHARDPQAWQGGLRPFDAFGPYQLIKRLGAGGMAEVILARRQMGEGVDKLVALKLVFHEYASHPRLSELFLTEARLSATLQHPNVIQVFDVGSAAGRPFIAMEYVHGRNGAELIQRLREQGKPPPVPLALAIVIELGKALEYLHEKKDLDGRPLHLVHRDVSPGNLLVSLHGAVKLVDMGVASASIASGQDTLMVGKRAYMAPEQAAGGMPEPGWDIYGMGLVLHELLTLERPFEGIGDPAAIAASRRVRLQPSASQPRVPPELDRLVQWATEFDRTRRAPSARALRVALEQVRDALPPFDLVKTMRELFGEELEDSQRETETLIGAARQRDGGDPSRAWRRLWASALGLLPRAVRLGVARHRRKLRWGAVAAMVALTGCGALVWEHFQRESMLAGHLEAADRLIGAAKLVGPGEDTALAHLKAARALRPDDPRLRTRMLALADTFEKLGLLASARGDVAEAVAHFRAALEADPSRRALRARIQVLEDEVRTRPPGRRTP